MHTRIYVHTLAHMHTYVYARHIDRCMHNGMGDEKCSHVCICVYPYAYMRSHIHTRAYKHTKGVWASVCATGGATVCLQRAGHW